MVTLANLGRLYGNVVERATLSRDLLAPVSAQLSGGPSDLHRRCVLAQCLGFFRQPDDVRADLAPFGDVEAVAVCRILHNAVIVFRTASGAATALQRQAETPIGLFSPVPPLHYSFPSCFIQPGLIQVALCPPPTVPTSSGEANTE
ncbi:hypothetical protein BAE44_0003077 [Dichanthelium oligosanthes]|uniref:Uncharacterized protein n=1 Tax=Dichanthelium oligosanthes TaxID=888268 RepID=A0A1E5WEY3_9POAL|nr:hypothetical protein BAE44_0003077 [Dichanthelium oligosanthes]